MKSFHSQTPRGFALVVTLSLMILLTIIAVGLLGLSAVSLRSSSQGMAQSEAKANARLALMLAIGELQKNAGPDIRITAPADIIDLNNPPLTGVWKSWEGTDHEATGTLAGRPKKPGYDQKKQPAASGGRFLSWLVSGTNSATAPGDAGSLVRKTPSATSVALVSSGSLATGDQRQVHVEPVAVNGKGKYGWWMSGENQKARLPKPFEPKNDDASGWSDLARSHAVADPKVFELESLLADASPAEKTYTLATADLFATEGASSKPHQSFHDLSATSVGLLTNVATGGWRKDLSLLTESWNKPASGLELFQVSPTQNLTFTKPTTSDYLRAKSLFYAWSDYRRKGGGEQTFHRRGAVSSWTNLANYTTLYKQMTPGSPGLPGIDAQTWPYNGSDNIYNGLHKPWVMPQIARVQIIASHFSTRQRAASGKLRPAVLYTPVITLWNPYGVELRLPGKLHLRIGYAMPLALKYTLPGVSGPDYWAVQGPQTNASYPNNRITDWNYGWQVRFEENPLVLKPGETRVYSPAENFLSDETYTNKNIQYSNVDLSPGVRNGVGFYYALDRILQPNVGSASDIDPDKVSLPTGTMLKADAKFDVAAQNLNGAAGCGLFIQWNVGKFKDPQHGNVTAHYRPDEADQLYPPLTGLSSVSLAECENNPVPFLSMIYGSRIANHRATATKGMVQANPLVTFTATGLNNWYADLYPGGLNPTNMPWDFSFIPHSSGPGDDMLPNVDDATNSGYIITGVRKAEGIARCMMSELPLRPLASLGDLTHWHLRGLNPVAPHGHNLIANSDASPLISMDDVVNRPNNPYANQTKNEQQDDSYCANHLLFDDWFFSSIAPEPNDFGPSGKTQKENYTEFLMDQDPLANRAYQPILEDAVTDLSAANKLYTDHVAPTDSWRTIASRLEVEGMFNVNSTSVKAWRALLGHARNRKVPYLTDTGSTALSGETDHVFSRTSIAGDKEAGKTTPGTYFATTEFTGYRILDDDFLDALAEEVVEQIRKRGPFLSLSEFVNRQLSDDKSIALAGAIQAALNEVAANSSTNPFDTLEGESNPSSADPPGNDDYAFREAAVGYSAYGLPGWTRQADVLRPLAPILSARDDTFTIRTYGDARSADGKVLARAWCEATVRRTRNFSDESDAADLTTAPVMPANQRFGRSFQIISFRWLSPAEI